MCNISLKESIFIKVVLLFDKFCVSPRKDARKTYGTTNLEKERIR